MFNNGPEDQYVKLSRKEFVALKAHLAKLRGFAVEALTEPLAARGLK